MPTYFGHPGRRRLLPQLCFIDTGNQKSFALGKSSRNQRRRSIYYGTSNTLLPTAVAFLGPFSFICRWIRSLYTLKSRCRRHCRVLRARQAISFVHFSYRKPGTADTGPRLLDALTSKRSRSRTVSADDY